MFPARPAALVLCLTIFCSAQRPEATGTVTGHVVCADTNLPARIAHVLLEPIVDNTLTGKTTTGEQSREPATALTETLLDGSFTISNVIPGNYYVFVEKLGYLSPLAQLSREDLNHPKPDTVALIAKLLTPVTVAGNRTSTVDVRILKGAAISGTIRFDDGTPDANAGVSLLAKDKAGEWVPFRTKLTGPFNGNITDDQGRYRISGLPAGEYILQTTLELSDIVVDHVFNESGNTYNNIRYSLDIYTGDVLRKRDAKRFKLDEGAEYSLLDITIPISKLHAVSGSILAAGTGHTINAGEVAVLYSDDGTQLVSTEIAKDDSAFHFYYVPEGEYTLKVIDARDVTREEISNGPGAVPATRTIEKKIRDYEAQPQPIIIQGDMTGITISAQPKSTK